jgi:ATP-citrate lyase beta-subunit
MKLRESDSFGLLDKYGILHPQIYAVGERLLGRRLHRVVVKANLATGGKEKAGLVRVCFVDEVPQTSREISEKMREMGMNGGVIVEEFIEHSDEYFVALKAVREGVEVYYSSLGGVEIESNWEKVEKVLVTTDSLEKKSSCKEDFFFKLVAEKAVREWIVKLIEFFQEEDATYLEINPFIVSGQGTGDRGQEVMPLGVVLILDDAAGFRHPDWPEVPEEKRSEREKHITKVDSEIRGSVKLVEVPGGGDTAVMGGGGATMFLCDAIIENGFKLANYAEFSGNPPDFAVAELTKSVCSIPGIKNLVIGSGIANFTSVMGNFKGMIEGFKASPMAKKLNIVIRRCGPQEDAAIEMMKEFANESGMRIQVFGRETGMTDIVRELT